MTDERYPTYLEVFPNTGHQFFTVDLADLLPDYEAAELRDLVRDNRGPWERWDDFTGFIRYQYDFETDPDSARQIPVLRLAVETNIGTSARGTLVEVDQYQRKRPEDLAGEDTPYAVPDVYDVDEYFAEGIQPLFNLPLRGNSGDDEGPDLGITEDRSVLNIQWNSREPEPVAVDLIIDLGNSRTVAVLLEAPSRSDRLGLEHRVQILRFPPRGTPPAEGVIDGRVSNDDCAIIDSWLVLHQPLFEPPPGQGSAAYERSLITCHEEMRDSESGAVYFRRKRLLPHMFVEISPALIGGGSSRDGAAAIFAATTFDRDSRFYLSSPKRYVWDHHPLSDPHQGDPPWKSIPNDSSRNPARPFNDLGGLFRFFMSPDGVDYPIDDPAVIGSGYFPDLSSQPDFPKGDAICWFALSVVEAAYRQVNSFGHLDLARGVEMRRRLRNVRVTYPAGWTSEEREQYFRQWRRALDIFTASRFPRDESPEPGGDGFGGNRPRLVDDAIDEAVASQLPILYADILSLGGDPDAWFDLYGDGSKVTVMIVDVGGGTSDYAIIEYAKAPSEPGSPFTLRPKLLVRDSDSESAGDELVRRVVEQVLLPAWFAENGPAWKQICEHPTARDEITALFRNPANAEYDRLKRKRSDRNPRVDERLRRAVRLVFIPLVNRLLSQLVNEHEWGELEVAECANLTSLQQDINDVLGLLLDRRCPELSLSGDLLSPKARLSVDRRAIESCIDEVFSDFFRSLGLLAATERADLLIFSGKPSELPRLQTLLAREVHLLPQRIKRVRGFPAGHWYPFNVDGEIIDAKTCTVVGAALYQDICNGNLRGFTIRDEHADQISADYHWAIMPTTGRRADFFDRQHTIFAPGSKARYDQFAESGNVASAEVTVRIYVDSQIGRVRGANLLVAPQPVYRLAWNAEEAARYRNREIAVNATIRWVSEMGKGERLELVGIEPDAEFPLEDTSGFSLELYTLTGGRFWHDAPRFDVVLG